MGYIVGGLGMHGQAIVAPIEPMMRLVRVGLGYEISSIDASRSVHPLICIGRGTLNHPLMIC